MVGLWLFLNKSLRTMCIPCVAARTPVYCSTHLSMVFQPVEKLACFVVGSMVMTPVVIFFSLCIDFWCSDEMRGDAFKFLDEGIFSSLFSFFPPLCTAMTRPGAFYSASSLWLWKKTHPNFYVCFVGVMGAPFESKQTILEKWIWSMALLCFSIFFPSPYCSFVQESIKVNLTWHLADLELCATSGAELSCVFMWRNGWLDGILAIFLSAMKIDHRTGAAQLPLLREHSLVRYDALIGWFWRRMRVDFLLLDKGLACCAKGDTVPCHFCCWDSHNKTALEQRWP